MDKVSPCISSCRYSSNWNIYSNCNLQQSTTAVPIIHLHVCPHPFPLFLKRNWIIGGLEQDSSILSLPSEQKGNILILSFIPQDWGKKNNFPISSLLEPCLIIPNYAARHLVLSVSPTMLSAHHRLAALCVFSHLRIIHEHVPPILAGSSAGTCSVFL